MVLIYVDDIIMTRNDSKKLQDFISQLDTTFALKDLGPLHYFLGIKFTEMKQVYISAKQST